MLVLGATAPLVWVLFVALRRMVENVRLANAAERSFDPLARPRPGPAILYGTVEPDGGPAVRVEIDQRGEEWSHKNGWSHRWRETARRVTARPFFLVLPSGEKVRVEPDPGVFLVDKLDQLVRRQHNQRTRAAELTPGEVVYASGALVEGEVDQASAFRGYREPPKRKLVLRAPRGGRMLIASERLGRRYLGRVWFHACWAFYAAAALAFMHGAFFLGYHLRAFRGHVVQARIDKKHTYVTSSGKSRTVHHDLWLAWDGGYFIEDAASRTFSRVEVGDVVPVVDVAGWRQARALGRAATVSASRALVMIGLSLLMAFGYRHRRERSRPWYDQRKVIDEGRGRL